MIDADGERLRLVDDQAGVPFGLSELRAVASAHDGHWQLGAAFAGKTLGQASARLNLRPRPEQRWPTADTPIDGLIEARVANIGIWGAWVPPGWRLTGALHASAAIGGRFGAPEYTGELSGAGIGVRNVLQGVDVRDGELKIAMLGDTARIQKFAASAGKGQLTLLGDASLGAAPRAELLTAPAYAAELGTLRRWGDARWITWGDDLMHIPSGQWLARALVGVTPVLRSSHFASQLAAAAAGLGVVLAVEPFRHVHRLAAVALARPLRAQLAELPDDELWLVGHRALRGVPRIAALWDFLVEAFTDPAALAALAARSRPG